MDKPTKDRISQLYSLVRNEVTKIIEECDKALTGKAKARISQGLRTFEEQTKLFNQRPKVTNAKAGQSIHNYGLAIDIVLIIDQKEASWDTAKDWDNDKIADWYECVKIFAKNSWKWGENWKTFKDIPHFEKRGFTWKKLYNKSRDKSSYVIL